MNGTNKIEVYGDSRKHFVSLSELQEYFGSGGGEIETITLPATAPWTGEVKLRKVGNRVDVTAELSGADPWEVENVILFSPPEGWRPSTFVLLTGFIMGGTIPVHYIEEGDMKVFYLNQKLSAPPEDRGNDVILATSYFID